MATAEYDPAAYMEWLDKMADRYEAARLHEEGLCGEDCPECRYLDSLEARADDERYERKRGHD